MHSLFIFRLLLFLNHLLHFLMTTPINQLLNIFSIFIHVNSFGIAYYLLHGNKQIPDF